MNRYAKSKQTKRIEFPDLYPYLSVVLYYHSERLGFEVTKKAPSETSQKKGLNVQKEEKKRNVKIECQIEVEESIRRIEIEEVMCIVEDM